MAFAQATLAAFLAIAPVLNPPKLPALEALAASPQFPSIGGVAASADGVVPATNQIRIAPQFPALKAPADALVPQQDQDRIAKILQAPPRTTEMVIEYRPVRSLEHTSMWHIGDSNWWVRLHASWGFSLNTLDKTKRYRVTGIILEQNYGVVEVWLDKLSPIEN